MGQYPLTAIILIAVAGTTDSVSATVPAMAGILDTLTLRYGPTPESDPLTIRPGPMTVLVGPNNSGKSLLLREIAHYVRGDKVNSQRKMLIETPWGSRQAERDWRFSGAYQVLQACTLRLPNAGNIRALFREKIRGDLGKLTFDQRGSDPVLGALLEAISSSVEEENESNLPDALPHLTVLEEANKLYKCFRELVEQRIIDPHRFCRMMGIDEASQLARLLKGEYQIDGMVVVQSIFAGQHNKLSELVALAKQGLEIVMKLQDYFLEVERFGELVAERVVNIDNYRSVLAPFTVLLDGYSRLQQIEPRTLSSFYEPAENYLTALHRDPTALEALRKRVYDTFGFYLAIDILDMSKARFVAANEHPAEREYSLGQDALAYFRQATDLRDKSDGVRSFVGIHAALMSNEYRLILLDEPEAFLHPPLVRRLGFDLTKMAADSGASIIAATHSADFLMGCVEAGHGVDIIRLSYENQSATARTLPADELMSMMRDPLLRSTGVLSALFHRSAVVCEGDTDGAFYGEINERLRLQAEKADPDEKANAKKRYPWVRDAVFINAHGKGSVPRLMGALRKIGVPAAAIVDLDLLLDDGVVGELLRQAEVDESVYKALGELRSQLHGKYKALAEKEVPPAAADADDATRAQRKELVKKKKETLIKRGGIANLKSAKDKKALEHFLDSLARYGIFVPACGELESWLPELGQDVKKGKRWLPTMFERMGTLGQPNYLKPGENDVWAFVRSIALWIEKSLTEGH